MYMLYKTPLISGLKKPTEKAYVNLSLYGTNLLVMHKLMRIQLQEGPASEFIAIGTN